MGPKRSLYGETNNLLNWENPGVLLPNIVVVDISKLGKEEGEDVAVNLKLDQNGSRKSTFDLSSKLQL